MMKPEYTKLRQEERSEQVQSLSEASAAKQAQEFASVDDLLRFDSQNHPVPPEVGERLNSSLAAEPPRNKPWYKKIFGN